MFVLVASDPATFLALLALLAAAVLALRLRSARLRNRAYARRLAEVSGHPSALGPARPVRISGPDGEYVSWLGSGGVHLRYETNAGVEFLGHYPSDDAAIEAIAAHEAAQSSRPG